jgi:hypothetical protein
MTKDQIIEREANDILTHLPKFTDITKTRKYIEHCLEIAYLNGRSDGFNECYFKTTLKGAK